LQLRVCLGVDVRRGLVHHHDARLKGERHGIVCGCE
jgi:hypothetical protein